MVIGVCRITLSIPGNDSLKGKRAVVRPILDRVRSRFNVSAAEVGRQDALGSAELGFAVVSNEGAHANSMIDTIADFVTASANAIVVDRSTELLRVGELGVGRRGA